MEHHPSEFSRRVCRNVAAAVEAASLTQRDVAARTGISLPTVNRYINGHASPRTDHLYAISLAVGVPVTTLVAVA